MARTPRPLADPEALEATRLQERLSLTRGEFEQQVAAGVAEQLRLRDVAASQPPSPPPETFEAETLEEAERLAKQRAKAGQPNRGIATPEGIYVYPN